MHETTITMIQDTKDRVLCFASESSLRRFAVPMSKPKGREHMTRMKILSVFAVAGLVGACGKSDNSKSIGDQTDPAGKAPAPAADRIAISVTEKGFEPDNIAVPNGKPVTLVFTRMTDSTCAKEIVIPLDGQKIERQLPLNEAVAVDVTFPKAGQITYACGMDMVKGVVTVR